MLDLLLGAVVFFLAQFWKKIDTQYGTEASKNLLLILAFLVSVILASIEFVDLSQKFSARTLLENSGQIWASAILIYQIAYKRIVLPILILIKENIKKA